MSPPVLDRTQHDGWVMLTLQRPERANALSIELRDAVSDARFAHPEFAWADMLYGPLDALVGGAVARDLLLTGRDLDPREALRCGLVSEVVEPDGLLGAVEQRMQRIAAVPRPQLMRTKAKAIRRAGIELVTSLQL